MDLTAIGQFIVNSAILGGLAGAIVGAVVWVIMERGGNALVPLLGFGVVGLGFGLFYNGSDLLRVISSRDQVLSTTEDSRILALNASITILGWIFVMMVVGAGVSNLRRALVGLILGSIFGTIAGALFLFVGPRVGFPINSLLTTALIGVITMLLMTAAAISGSD